MTFKAKDLMINIALGAGNRAEQSGGIFVVNARMDTRSLSRGSTEPTKGNEEAGKCLPREVRDWLEACFAEDLSTVRIHTGARAARLTLGTGAVALAHGEHVFFGPGCFAPESTVGQWLLAHEIAHILQQRRPRPGSRPARLASPFGLEVEANAAAFAAIAGQRTHVEPVPGCPQWQPVLPLIVVAAVCLAAGFGITYTVFSKDEKIRHDAESPEKFAYETLWGFIPVVGSLSQVIHGRSRLQRGLGTVFLMVDASMVGGIVKGVVFALGRRSLLRVGLTGAERVAERNAVDQLLRNGARFGTREEIAQTIREASIQGPVVLATSEGWLNHSVSYVIKDGQIWRIEGGPSRMFFKREARELTQKEIGKLAGEKFFGGANTISFYPVTKPMAEATLQWWQKELDKGALRLFVEAEGCAGSQALLLEQIGRGVPGAVGTSRFLDPLFPVVLDLNRMGGPGTHIIANGWGRLPRVTYGTLQQAGMWTAGRELFWTANYVNNIWPRPMITAPSAAVNSDMFPLEPFMSSEGSTLEGIFMQQVNPGELAAGLPAAMVGRLPVSINTGSTYPLKIALSPELNSALAESRRDQSGTKGGSVPGSVGPQQPNVVLSTAAQALLSAIGAPGTRRDWKEARQKSGLAPATANDAMQELEAKGMITVERFGSDSLNIKSLTRVK